MVWHAFYSDNALREGALLRQMCPIHVLSEGRERFDHVNARLNKPGEWNVSQQRE